MPAPLLWLGAAALSVYTADKANSAHDRRKLVVDFMPGESPQRSTPVNGSIVTCGIFGMLDHTGIWVNGNIYELAGSGLVRCLSPERFLSQRSGNQVYVACDPHNNVLFESRAATNAQSLLFTMREYHVLNQNCHKFVAETLANKQLDITSFSELNTFLHTFFNTPIRWNLTQINFR